MVGVFLRINVEKTFCALRFLNPVVNWCVAVGYRVLVFITFVVKYFYGLNLECSELC